MAVNTQVAEVCAVCCSKLARVVKSLAKQNQPNGAVSVNVIVTVDAAVAPVHLKVPTNAPPNVLVIVAQAPVPVTIAVVPPDCRGPPRLSQFV